MSGKSNDLESAKRECEEARKRVLDTFGAIKHRLSPRTIASEAWEDVREKGGVVADEALQAVRDRPGTVSGVVAGLFLFFAREPLWRFAGRLFKPRAAGDEDIVQADLDRQDASFDLTAPTVERSLNEGVNA